MRDDIHLTVLEDNGFERTEEQVIKNIKNQVINTYGDFTGTIENETDYIVEYLKKTYISKDPNDIIENFEYYSSDAGTENVYDYLTKNIISIFKDTIGINIDIDREMISFSDLYDIYIVFVLSLKNTLILSTKGYYTLIGSNNVNKINIETISEYILSDEFSANDDFIKNAAFNCEIENIINIKHMIDNFLIFIDHEKFTDFIFKYIMDTNF
jgi:hypothetical protein